MPVRVTVNSQGIEVPAGHTLFECAETMGVRVPTSCFKQGKCRECLVELVEGMELLSARSPEEEHLKGSFRLSCRARVESEAGIVNCHTLLRSAMRIEEGCSEKDQRQAVELDPAVTRDGDRVLLDGLEIASSEGPLHGLAVDLGTTTVVMRLIDLETGRRVATQSFENPQRFAGGFARHLTLDDARRIGLVPDLPDGKITQLGNASIEGSTIALLSRSRRRGLEKLVARIEHVELETDPDFFDFFVEGCQFKPVRSLRWQN